MREHDERDRRRAVERYLDGVSPAAICMALGYSRWGFYKWWRRFTTDGPDWFCERSRRPHTSRTRVAAPVEQLVTSLREQLDQEGLFSGAQAIHWELTDLGVEPIPSVRTIGRILARHDLTRRRRGRYVPKGRRYPALRAERPGVVHQSDFVGPCYLRGPVRFYSLNSVDVATNRCAVEPLLTRRGQQTIDAFWASWCRLGLPQHQQVDNESVFYGSPAHPRGMGMLIRLCLPQGVKPWFIPPGEPWRNGVVEKFNDHWQQKLLRRVELASAAALRAASQRFEAHHNSRYRYSKLGGKTPGAALAARVGPRCGFRPHPRLRDTRYRNPSMAATILCGLSAVMASSTSSPRSFQHPPKPCTNTSGSRSMSSGNAFSCFSTTPRSMPMTTNFGRARLLLSPHTTVSFPNSYLRVSDVMAVLAVSDVLALITYSLQPCRQCTLTIPSSPASTGRITLTTRVTIQRCQIPAPCQ